MVNQNLNFVLNFLKNAKCEYLIDSEVIILNDSPKSFQEFLNKKCPIKISIKNSPFFDFSLYEFEEKIRNFLDNSTKNCLIKIDFDVDFEKEIKKIVDFNDCKLSSIRKSYKNNFFTRFTFLTSFKYLNEKESFVNEIYVYDKKIIKGDLSGYRILEGNVCDLDKLDFKDDYEISKNHLKELLAPKKEIFAEKLSKLLQEETEKAKNHYSMVLSEFSSKKKEIEEKIKKIELEKESSSDNSLKIKKLQKLIKNNYSDEELEKIKKEQELLLKNLAQKYSLSIENKLINTTIIYYPVFLFDIFLNGSTSSRTITLSYDPLTKKLDGLLCESCGSVIKKVVLCGKGHIACDNCLKKCFDCNSLICGKCNIRKCSICAKTLCKNCYIRCCSCNNYVCKDHLRQDFMTKQDKCVNCLLACGKCHNLTSKSNIETLSDGSKICKKCIADDKRRKILKKVFDN